MRLLALVESIISFLSVLILVSVSPADLNNVRFSAYRTAMKLRRLQKALCCKYSSSIYSLQIYTSPLMSVTMGFCLSLQVHSSLIMSPLIVFQPSYTPLLFFLFLHLPVSLFSKFTSFAAAFFFSIVSSLLPPLCILFSLLLLLFFLYIDLICVSSLSLRVSICVITHPSCPGM